MNEEPNFLEEILIRETVSRIRKWLKERGGEEKGSSPPRGAIRFCGGCNPFIERGCVAQKIREELGTEVSWISGEEEKEIFLIINGCRTACADTNEIRSGCRIVVVAGDSVSD